jgi:hypothetical protein
MAIDFKHQTQLYTGLYERELAPWMKRCAEGIVSAADVGTAGGLYSLFFMGKTGAQKIFSFDPLDRSREEFLENLRLNGWSSGGRLVFSQKFVGKEKSADMETLDSLLPELAEPCLIKMDVEGAEVEVLKGAASVLARAKTRWVIEVHSEPLEKEVLSIFQKAGYRTRIVDNAWWRCILPEQRLQGHNRWVIAAKDLEL